jgi:hypothetical protein
MCQKNTTRERQNRLTNFVADWLVGATHTLSRIHKQGTCLHGRPLGEVIDDRNKRPTLRKCT